MKYRSKLLLLFITTALLTNGVSLGILHRQAKNYLLDEMRATLMTVAWSAASTLDVGKHETIRNRGDETSTTYKELEAHLRKMRDVNRRKDVQVKFIYTLRRDPSTPHGALFVLDAEEEGADKSHVGEVYKFKGMENRPPNFLEPEIIPEFVEDQWGLWMSGTVPIRDKTGTPIALLGVDIDAKNINRKLDMVLTSGLLAMGASVLVAVVFALTLSRWVSKPLSTIRCGVEAVGQGKLETVIDLDSKDEFGAVARAINDMILGLRQRENLKSTLVRYVSKDVADKIVSSGEMPVVQSERRKVTMLFSDVRGFTSLSESMQPEEIVAMLNQYFDKMIEAIFRNQGNLNKFIGDGLMAMFGAPTDDPYQEEHAIRAALEMRKEVLQLGSLFKRDRDCEFRIGIGINTGVAVVGNIGSEQKMEYTAIGDSVNLASRIESKTKEFEVDILVSEYTYVAVRNQFRFRNRGSIQVKGKADSIQVYEVLGAVGDDLSPLSAEASASPAA